ncbi:hypothetical protein SNE40_013803 [Patella caerulea]|uniref:Uncharacterized protein n=1 Tax=Patella caerulea TaxID=87958 RepID=A0AAN8JEA6_PATCE
MIHDVTVFIEVEKTKSHDTTVPSCTGCLCGECLAICEETVIKEFQTEQIKEPTILIKWRTVASYGV